MRVKDIMVPSKGKLAETNVNQEESIDNAATIMKSRNLKTIQVVDDDNKVVGVLTRESFINASDDLNEDFFLD